MSNTQSQESACASMFSGLALCIFGICFTFGITGAFRILPQRLRPVSRINCDVDVNIAADSKRRFTEFSRKVKENLSSDIVDYERICERLKDLELTCSQPSFWDDQPQAHSTMQQVTAIKSTISRVNKWNNLLHDVESLIDMSFDDDESSCKKLLIINSNVSMTNNLFQFHAAQYIIEAKSNLDELEKDLAMFEVERLLNGKYDACGCGMTIQSGAGGTEAQDWAGMLLRMYKRFAERRGYKVTVIEEMKADFGIKSVELKIEGQFAYGYLSGEKGTHRLVRISPFNALGKRQTSFAGVETWPIVEDDTMKNIEIPEKVHRIIIIAIST